MVYRYEDFFTRKTDNKGKRKARDRSDHMEMDEEVYDDDDDNQVVHSIPLGEKETVISNMEYIFE